MLKQKSSELKAVDDSNEKIKQAHYDKQIEKLNRDLGNIEKQRVELQHKLELSHQAWTCKL